MEKMKEFSVAGIDAIPNTADPDYYKFVLDISGSMELHESLMCSCIKEYKSELLRIDEASAISISRVDFDDRYYDSPFDCIDNLSTKYRANGGTDLYGAIVKAVNSTIKAQEKLIEEGYEPRMTVIILTDGEHNTYTGYSFSDAKESVEFANSHGITMVFVDFGGKNGKVPKSLGFSTVYDCENSASALKDTFRKITTSCIRQSQSKVVDPENWMI